MTTDQLYLLDAMSAGLITPNQARSLTKFVGPIEACRFAGIDSDRLNEAIAAGWYKHAPKTRGGHRRLFSVSDLVSLRIYAELCMFGFSRRRAGCLVGQILKTGEVSDESKTIFLKFDMDKIEHAAMWCVFPNGPL